VVSLAVEQSWNPGRVSPGRSLGAWSAMYGSPIVSGSTLQDTSHPYALEGGKMRSEVHALYGILDGSRLGVLAEHSTSSGAQPRARSVHEGSLESGALLLLVSKQVTR
jgi:hypothetical protein